MRATEIVDRLTTVAVGVLVCIALLLLGTAQAETCPSAKLCRDGGQLIHKQNSNHTYIYTVDCAPGPGETSRDEWSNGSPKNLDEICSEISQCKAAGSFGRFMAAVTDHCVGKHFTGYFGLDGMTFGILDFTAENLPQVVKAYWDRSPDDFEQHLGKIGLPIKDGCWQASDLCDRNRAGALTCRADFHTAFKTTVRDAEFQKAEVEVALKKYSERIESATKLGLKTEYGVIAIATIKNNLKGRLECNPSTWKQACVNSVDESKLVHCMLDQYASHDCRAGSSGAAASRRDEINKEFASVKPSGNIHPSLDQVLSCSANWGKDD